MSNANVAHIQSLYAAFGRGDVATIVAGLTPDVDWETVGRQKRLSDARAPQGHRAVEEFFKLVAENEDFSDFTPREFYAADDKVFVLGSYSLTVRKTGRPIASEWVHVFTLKRRQGRALPRAHRHREIRRGVRGRRRQARTGPPLHR